VIKKIPACFVKVVSLGEYENGISQRYYYYYYYYYFTFYVARGISLFNPLRSTTQLINQII